MHIEHYERMESPRTTMLKQEQMTMPDFTHSDTRMSELLNYLHEIEDLKALGDLAEWDQNTVMPNGAAEIRGTQVATLRGLLHERWTSPQLGTMLDSLRNDVQQDTFTDADRGLVRKALREYEQGTKLPRSLVEEMTRTGFASFEAWRHAREQNDFATFAPWLKRTIALQREVADLLGYTGTRYDALLDNYEPGLTASKVDELFAPVRDISKNMLQRIEASGNTIDDTCLQGNFSTEQQMALSDKILRAMGYDFNHGQLAQSPHPFTTSFGSPYDVRVTTRVDKQFLQAALMASIHEGGHALYEQGSAPTLVRTPIAGGASMGAHESQSRMWENAIGRSLPFWQSHFALVQETFPTEFAQVDYVTFARALNKVQPSLIRVEADEVTYNLHIIIRFELEKMLINGDVAVESLPRLWNEKYQEYLGITPPTDTDGVMQDMHWTFGFGYFPTYTLGNLYGAQILHKLYTVFPDFDEKVAQGNTAFVHDWMREHMYSVGAIYQPETLIERVTGEKPNPQYFEQYLTSKFEALYNLPR
jgi:carboxypeptidase Taq